MQTKKTAVSSATSADVVAERFGCAPAQARRQYARNAEQLRGMCERALETGRKVNGYTADELARMAAKMEDLSEDDS
jgi:hypothetical protein